MAYDPNDPEDKKIVSKLIADAVKAALEEQVAEHTEEVNGLKTKNKELLGKLNKAKEGQQDPENVSKLENELEASQTALKEAQKELRKVTKELETANTNFQAENQYAQSLLVDGGLTEALTKAKVTPEFMPAVKALLKPQVAIKVEGNDRKAVVGEKSLGDFVTEWSQSDAGKVYVSANSNGGTGAPGAGQANNGGGKTLNRAAFEQMDMSARGSFIKEGGKVVDNAA